jgi:phosphoribosylformylglycinamidine (FGAM) synthase-like amidotransferase family enzyme
MPPSSPTVAILHAPGTNRSADLARAFALAGGAPSTHRLRALEGDPSPLRSADIIALPGGFSFGDALGAGRLFALSLGTRLGDILAAHVDAGRQIVGICNGFQALLRAGLLTPEAPSPPPIALVPNACGHFVAGWTTLSPNPRSNAPAVAALAALSPTLDCPVAHAEGRIFAPRAESLDTLEASGRVAFVYATRSSSASDAAWLGNPNGSAHDIAGVSDPSGRVIGLMPHPENHLLPAQHPAGPTHPGAGAGLLFFRALLAAA